MGISASAVYLIGKTEIPIHYTTWGQVEQALLKNQMAVEFLWEFFKNFDQSTGGNL